MGRLSEHFDSQEFTCHCGCGLDTVSPHLISALEELRAKVGKPIRVLSGLRCQKHNRKVGGALDSRHLSGEAADVATDIPLTDFLKLAHKVGRFARGGIGIYPQAGFLHVDIRPQLARWGHLDGKYVAFHLAYLRAEEMERTEHDERSTG